MSRKRILLSTPILVVTLVAGFGLFRPKTAVAQQSGIPEHRRSAIPKAFGRLVGGGVYPEGGSGLFFEAGDGTIRIVRIDGRYEVIVFPRN
jgi:hypothetical protein